ncbi:MAG: MFS transporter [Candidatus Heimdallarchaeota archaeon]
MIPETIENNKRQRSVWFDFEKNEILLLISYFIYGVAFANYEPYAPIWLSQISQNGTFLLIGFVVIIPSIVGVIGAPFWGFLADKFGSKKFVILGNIAFSLMFTSLIFNISSTYFLIMVLVGFLFGSAHTANLLVLATKSVSKPKEVIFAKFTIAVSLAFVIFSPLAGWIYDKFANSMIIQLSIAIVASAIAAIFIFFVKEKRIEKKFDEKKQNASEKQSLTVFPLVFIGILIFAFIFQSGGGFWAYSSIYFLETLNVDGIYFSIFIIVKTALAVPLSLLLGRVKKEKSIGLIIVCFTVYFVFVYSLMTIFPTKWILLIIFYSLPMYPLYNVFLYGLIANYSNKSRRALAFGIFNAIGTLGYISGIIIMGVIADIWQTGTYAGIYSMFPISVILAGLTFIIAVLFHVLKLRNEIESSN